MVLQDPAYLETCPLSLVHVEEPMCATNTMVMCKMAQRLHAGGGVAVPNLLVTIVSSDAACKLECVSLPVSHEIRICSQQFYASHPISIDPGSEASIAKAPILHKPSYVNLSARPLRFLNCLARSSVPKYR